MSYINSNLQITLQCLVQIAPPHTTRVYITKILRSLLGIRVIDNGLDQERVSV